MGIPKAPELTTEQIAKEILAVLKSGKGFYYHVIWSKVLGVHFGNSPENDHRLRQTLDSLVKGGQVVNENGWFSLRKGENAQEVKITAFSRELISR